MLGWTPEQALTTPIPWLQLAIEGRVDWECRKNGQEPATARKRQSEPDPEVVKRQIKTALGGRAKAQARRRERSRRKSAAGATTNTQSGQ